MTEQIAWLFIIVVTAANLAATVYLCRQFGVLKRSWKYLEEERECLVRREMLLKNAEKNVALQFGVLNYEPVSTGILSNVGDMQFVNGIWGRN